MSAEVAPGQFGHGQVVGQTSRLRSALIQESIGEMLAATGRNAVYAS
jgi:hypothetical protein